MSTDIDYRDILVTKRVEIVQCLNFERTLLLDYLRSNYVFDKEDYELIMEERGNRSRAGKLVDFLVTRGPDAYQHFIDVIQVEKPTLYESLTGEKASSRPSPLMEQLVGHQLIDGEGSSSQLQVLSEHLQRTYGDLRDISVNFTSLLKTKIDLEEKLVKAEKNLEFEKERRSEFEKRLTKVVESDDGDQASDVFLLHEYDDLQKGIADRDVYIIVLQMKLLTEKEECDRLRSKLEEFERKNEIMACDLRRVTENYHKEKGQSSNLSQRIRLQVDEIQKMEELKNQVSEAMLLRDERDGIAEELKELKKWAEALKVRFDIVEKEKYELLEKNEHVGDLQDLARNLQRKVAISQIQVEEFKKRNEILGNDCEIFKKQRDYALEARKLAIDERDKVNSEKETILIQYNELQSKTDKFNEERVALHQNCDALEKRYKTTVEELGQLKGELYEKEIEAEDLNRLLAEAEEKNRRNSRLMEIVPPRQRVDEESSDSDDSAKESDEKNATPANQWRERRLKSLLKSMKLRIAGERSVADIMSEQGSAVSGTMTWEVLHWLLPNLNSRSNSSATQAAARTAQHQALTRKNQANDKAAETSGKDKASTLPCRTSGNTNNTQKQFERRRAQRRGRSNSDINDTSDFMRPRSEHVANKKYGRSQSTEQPSTR